MKAGKSQTIYPSPLKLASENPIQAVNREKYQFASDNTAGLCPETMEALVRANAGTCAAIGGGGARFMCSWSTTEEDVAQLLRDCAVG